MSPKFEGNLAHVPQSETVAKRISGVVEKGAWKDLKDVNPADFEDDGIEELDSSALEVDDGIEELKDKDVEVVELKPVDLSADASQKEDAAEGLNALARADRRKSKRSVTSDDLKVVKENPIDVTGEEVMDMDDDVQMIDAKGKRLADAFGELQRRDVDKNRLESAKRSVRARIAQREENIARLDRSTKDYELQKAEIEADSAQLLKTIEAGAQEGFEAEARAAEKRAQPMREVARQLYAQEAKEKMAPELEKINAQLEMNAEGKILGLKNLPLVDWNAFRRGMAGRMEAIKNETLQLLEQPSSTKRDARLKALETESSEWMKSYQEGKMMEEEGKDGKDIQLRNHQYRQIETINSEGLEKVDAETLAISSDERLKQSLEILAEQDKLIDGLLQKAGEVMWNVDDSDLAKKAEQTNALHEFLKGADEYRVARKEALRDKIDYLKLLDKPEFLDMRTKRLTILSQQAESQITYLQKSLGKTSEKASMEVAMEAIRNLEEKDSQYKKDISEWQNHPLRQEAMNARHLDLAEKIERLEYESDRQDWKEISPGIDRKATEQSAQESLEEYRSAVLAARDRIFGLANQKSDIAKERAAIIEEQVDRELLSLGIDVDVEPVAYDVDLSELNESTQESSSKKNAA